MATLHTEAVPAKVVVPTRRTHQPSRRIGLQPPFVLAPVPDSVLRPKRPSPSFAVQHREVAHRDAERSSLQVADAPFLDQELVADLRFGKRIDSHAESMPVGIT